MKQSILSHNINSTDNFRSNFDFAMIESLRKRTFSTEVFQLNYSKPESTIKIEVKELIYQCIFLIFSIIFFVLACIIFIKTPNWHCHLYFRDGALAKTFIETICLILSISSF